MKIDITDDYGNRVIIEPNGQPQGLILVDFNGISFFVESNVDIVDALKHCANASIKEIYNQVMRKTDRPLHLMLELKSDDAPVKFKSELGVEGRNQKPEDKS